MSSQKRNHRETRDLRGVVTSDLGLKGHVPSIHVCQSLWEKCSPNSTLAKVRWPHLLLLLRGESSAHMVDHICNAGTPGLSWEDLCQFNISLGYSVAHCLKERKVEGGSQVLVEHQPSLTKALSLTT